MYMTDEKIMQEAQVIINVYAPLILKELGIDMDDSILKRISISDEVSGNTPNGICTARFKSHRFSMLLGHYVDESSEVTLYPLMVLQQADGKGGAKPLPRIVRLFRKQLRKSLLSTLAHELRHYWQYTTGEYAENEKILNGRNLVPYEERWCERDANAFAHQFVKGTKLV